MQNHGAEPTVAALDEQILERGVRETCELVTREPDDLVARALAELSPALAVRVLQRLPHERRGAVERVAPEGWADQWRRNEIYPEGSIGRLMTPPLALVPPDVTVGDAIERVRETVSRALVTYVFVVDDEGALTGLLTFRDLLYADRSLPLESVMIARPFALRPEAMVGDARRRCSAVIIRSIRSVTRPAGSSASSVGRRCSSTKHSRSARRPGGWSVSTRKSISRRRGCEASRTAIPGCR
jgi:Mg/Co/Ni transporter MgtE